MYQLEPFLKSAKRMGNEYLGISVAQYIEQTGQLEKAFKEKGFKKLEIDRYGNSLSVCLKENMWTYKINLEIKGENLSKVMYYMKTEKFHPKKIDREKNKYIWEDKTNSFGEDSFISCFTGNIARDFVCSKNKLDEMQQKDYPTKTEYIPKEVFA